MKFVDTTSLSLPSGVLTLWRPIAPPLSDERWRKDTRRASCLQEASLLSTFEALDSGATPPPSWLGCTFEMPADLDADTFAAALRLWINRHDTLRSMLVPLDAPMANSQLQRFTLDPGTVDIEHVTVDTAAAIARHEPLSTVIEYLFDEQVGPCRWPGYLLLTISHSRATTVCLAVDHSLIDGYGLLKLPRELHMLYAVAQGTQAPLSPAESYPDFAEAERREAEALTASDETVQRWRHCLEAFGGTLPPFPINVHHPDTTAPPQRGGYLELLDDATTRAFTQQCRTAGGDIFSGLFACLAKAARELTGNPAFHTMAPFQTQPSHWSSSLGWYVGMAPVTFPLGEEETFETAIAHAAQGLQALKTLALVPITRVAELLGQPLRDTFMVSFMDLRRVPGAREWEKWRVVSFRSRSNDPDEVCLWFMRTHNGLIVDYRHPATAAADRVVADYIARTKRQLNAIASTAKWYAPSS